MEWKILANNVTYTKQVGKRTVIKTESVPTTEQVDEVGNVCQISGAVIAKICQFCELPFESTQVKVPIKENVFTYKCDKCSFENASADLAWDHGTANPTHTISKSSRERLVGDNTILQGRVARVKVIRDEITKLPKDCIIACDECIVSGKAIGF